MYKSHKKGKTHRVVVESYLGRKLKPKEVVHHINENKHDNRIENLIVFANQEYHSQCHRSYDLNSNLVGYYVKVDKSRNIEEIKKVYKECFGIVLYGPFCKNQKLNRLERFKEITKKALANNAGASFVKI